jgi:peptide/nickel transport system substrate-binding protein
MSRREFLRRATVAGVSLTVASSLLAACDLTNDEQAADNPEGSGSGAVRRGGIARLGTTVPAADVDPVTQLSDGALFTTQVCAEALCFPRPDFSLEPMLATNWQAGATPKEWTFRLREGVKFHDGSTMSADDVVATFDRLTNPDSESAALATFTGILSYQQVEKIDDKTVRFHLDRPYADFPGLVSSINYNALILPKNYEIGTFTQGGIGTGPYILKEYRPEQGATYVKNPNYWMRGKPYMEGVEVSYYDDNSPLALALQAGEVDFTPTVPYQGSQALFENPEITILSNSSGSYRAMHMRVDTEPFDDKRVRQALALSLDRPALVEGLFDGRADLGNDHSFAPVYTASPPEGAVPQRTQDYEMAKRLLADAGHPDGIDVELTCERYLEVPQYAVTVKEQLKPAGINLKLNILPQPEYYGSGDNQPWLEVPLGIIYWQSRVSASQAITPAYLCGAIWNSAHWCNEEYDKLIREYDAELDQQRRKEIATSAAKIQQDETPVIIAYWGKEYRPIRKNVRDLARGPVAALDMSGVWLSE